MTERPTRSLPPITAESTREEVLAYLEESDRVWEWVKAHPEEGLACGEPGDDDPTHWDRTEAGDVTNGLAFHAFMDLVGEEDQSQPGWDGP